MCYLFSPPTAFCLVPVGLVIMATEHKWEYKSFRCFMTKGFYLWQLFFKNNFKILIQNRDLSIGLVCIHYYPFFSFHTQFTSTIHLKVKSMSWPTPPAPSVTHCHTHTTKLDIRTVFCHLYCFILIDLLIGMVEEAIHVAHRWYQSERSWVSWESFIRRV